MAILVYVDDLIIAGNDETQIQVFKQLLHSKFKLKDLGLLKYFFRIELSRSKEGMSLSQRKYVCDILDEFSLLNVKPSDIHVEQKLNISALDGEALLKPSTYR